MMWKLVRYLVGGKVVVTIGTFTKHASIFFARRSELAVARGLLEGGGKSFRYITLRTPADAGRSNALSPRRGHGGTMLHHVRVSRRR